MSWSDGRRRFLLAAAAGAAPLLLAGCGFQPLYGRGSVGAVDDDLARVEIGLIPDRIGQQVHNYLLDRINRAGRPERARHRLDVRLSSSKVILGIERDQTATRAKLVLTADFDLTDLATGEVVLRRSARSANSYNIVDSALATRSAELDATDRAARELAEEIRLILALYFRRRAAEGGDA